jgi:hypothetical protein
VRATRAINTADLHIIPEMTNAEPLQIVNVGSDNASSNVPETTRDAVPEVASCDNAAGPLTNISNTPANDLVPEVVSREDAIIPNGDENDTIPTGTPHHQRSDPLKSSKTCPRPRPAYLSALHERAEGERLAAASIPVPAPSPSPSPPSPASPPPAMELEPKKRKRKAPSAAPELIATEGSRRVRKLTEFGLQHAKEIEAQKEKSVQKKARQQMTGKVSRAKKGKK